MDTPASMFARGSSEDHAGGKDTPQEDSSIVADTA